jgi:hypothetical protein
MATECVVRRLNHRDRPAQFIMIVPREDADVGALEQLDPRLVEHVSGRGQQNLGRQQVLLQGSAVASDRRIDPS